jgi:hypothetical protein
MIVINYDEFALNSKAIVNGQEIWVSSNVATLAEEAVELVYGHADYDIGIIAPPAISTEFSRLVKLTELNNYDANNITVKELY